MRIAAGHLARALGAAAAGPAWRRYSRRAVHNTMPVAMASRWRPSLDDIDRLSKGDGAKRRGTGNFNIPHRLNAEERPVYESAKKKGYLAVRGTGYRKGRKGHPLPNIWRQVCDARAQPCIVVEQDMGGGGLDAVVVDLAPLRLLDTSQAARACASLAEERGARQVLPPERLMDDVPFNVIPVDMPEHSQDDGVHGIVPPTAAPPTTEARVAVDNAVAEQASAVRQLKASGHTNSSPEVQRAVQLLLELKAEATKLHEAAGQTELSGAASKAGNGGSDGVGNNGGDEDASSNSSSTSSAAAERISDSKSRRRAEVLDDDHPFATLAIWQLPPKPLFFEAPRAEAKELAKQIAAALADVAKL